MRRTKREVPEMRGRLGLFLLAGAIATTLWTASGTARGEDLSADLFSHPAAIGEKIYTGVISRLHAQREGQSGFVQSKKITALKRPLLSKGVLAISAQNGICWNTRSPFKTILVVSTKGIKTKVGDADAVFESAEDKVEIRSFAEIMLALFNADEVAMRQQFDIFFTGTDAAWTLGLKPRSKILAKFLDRIVVTGTGGIERIQIFERTGDTADIQVTAMTPAEADPQSECFE